MVYETHDFIWTEKDKIIMLMEFCGNKTEILQHVLKMQ